MWNGSEQGENCAGMKPSLKPGEACAGMKLADRCAGINLLYQNIFLHLELELYKALEQIRMLKC